MSNSNKGKGLPDVELKLNDNMSIKLQTNEALLGVKD